MVYCSQELFAQKIKRTGAHIPPSSRNWSFCLSLMSKSSYEKFDKPPERYFSSHKPVFERFEHLITGLPNLQFTRKQCVGESRGPMSKSKALETALDNKILSSHAHLKKGIFSPRPPVLSAGHSPARLSAAQWSQTHFGSFQTLGEVVASRQSPAGQLIQPADRWFCTQNSKSHFPLAYILTWISHRVFGVDKEEL